MGKDKIIVVDGANVAYEERSQDGLPKVSNLVEMRRLLIERGYTPVIILDASLVYKVDDRRQMEALIKDQTYRQAPAETDADYFVLEFADENDAYVVSNDQYEDYQQQFPWIRQRRMPFMIINGEVELYQPDRKLKK